MSKITDLLDQAKYAIAEGETCYRAAAEAIAEAQAAGATQQQIANHVRRSQPWISQLLSWRKSGYKGGAFDRSHRARISPANNQKPKAKPATTGEQARAKHAKAHADAAKAEAQKAKAEAAKARAEAKAEAARARAARAEEKRAHAEAFAAAWGGHKKKEIHSGTRTLIVKALGMLGSDHDGEILAAARKAEQLRKREGLTWDELIIEAVPAAKAAA